MSDDRTMSDHEAAAGDAALEDAALADAAAEALEPIEPQPAADPIAELLEQIEVAPNEIAPELRTTWSRGYGYARRALLGQAQTTDELNVLGWACAWTAYRDAFPPAWKEAGDALRRAATATGDAAARARAVRTLRIVKQAAGRLGISP